ncbi:MAG: PEP/pyruvate-binding domain-containing protein [Candidatus Aceula lacicola]|nr:PEP/pyruvate-binding domain-containing protein [Candidatus Aceula lacicola]
MQSALVKGLDEVFKGDKLVVLEGGLGWFEELRQQYGEDLASIFIAPFSDKEFEEHAEYAEFSIVSYETAKRIHKREYNLGQITDHDNFVDRTREAAYQVKRRHEYSKVLVNTFQDSPQAFNRYMEKLTDQFALEIFGNVYKAIERKGNSPIIASSFAVVLVNISSLVDWFVQLDEMDRLCVGFFGFFFLGAIIFYVGLFLSDFVSFLKFITFNKNLIIKKISKNRMVVYILRTIFKKADRAIESKLDPKYYHLINFRERARVAFFLIIERSFVVAYCPEIKDVIFEWMTRAWVLDGEEFDAANTAAEPESTSDYEYETEVTRRKIIRKGKKERIVIFGEYSGKEIKREPGHNSSPIRVPAETPASSPASAPINILRINNLNNLITPIISFVMPLISKANKKRTYFSGLGILSDIKRLAWIAKKQSAPNVVHTNIVILEPLSNKSNSLGRKISIAAFLYKFTPAFATSSFRGRIKISEPAFSYLKPLSLPVLFRGGEAFKAAAILLSRSNNHESLFSTVLFRGRIKSSSPAASSKITKESLEAKRQKLALLIEFAKSLPAKYKNALTTAKFIIYSGTPGGGKGLTWEGVEKVIKELFSKNKDISTMDKFRLFHTRGIRPGENQDDEYHFRYPEHLEDLEKEFKIITTPVNGQPQGLALYDFTDTYKDPTDGGKIKTCEVKGLDSKLKQNKITILEGGIGWFDALNKIFADFNKYPQYQGIVNDGLFSLFISPLTEDQIAGMKDNHAVVYRQKLSQYEQGIALHESEYQRSKEVQELLIAKILALAKQGQEVVAAVLEDLEQKMFKMDTQDDFTSLINKASLIKDQKVISRTTTPEDAVKMASRLETVIRIHKREIKEAKEVIKEFENLVKEGKVDEIIENLSGDTKAIKKVLYVPIGQKEFRARSNEAAIQVWRRLEYKKLLYNVFVHTDEELNPLRLDLGYDFCISFLENLKEKVSSAVFTVRYRDLEETFVDDLKAKIVLDAKKRGVALVKGSEGSEKLALLLNDTLKSLETLAKKSNDEAFKQYLKELLTRNDNRGSPIRITVTPKLPVETARYYHRDTNEIEFILNERFALELLSVYDTHPKHAAAKAAVRIFHELGHTRFINQYQYYKEEYELIKKDLQLYLLIKDEGSLGNADYLESYRNLLKVLEEDCSIVEDFDLLIAEIERLEEQAEEVYRDREHHSVGNTREHLDTFARDQRIQEAFVSADPDYFADSFAKRLSRKQSIENTFLAFYREVLGHRGIMQGREAFLFLAKDQVTIAPFNQLKAPRVPPNTEGVLVDVSSEEGRKKESTRWARQYYPLHKGRRFADGIGVTEAENGRGMQQRWHVHETTQEFTTSICDNTQVRWAREVNAGEKTKMSTRDNKEIEVIVQGKDKNKEVIEIEDNGKIIKIVVVAEKLVAFANMIAMPKSTFHTLKNTRTDVPSIDFTVKDPVTQIMKTFSPPEEVALGEPKILEPKKEENQWGTIYEHEYLSPYNTRLLINDFGQMAYELDEKGNPVPQMYDLAHMRLRIVEVKPGKTTDKFIFSSIYEDEQLQVVRIFPWPKQIPQDNPKDSSKNWILDRDHSQIKAKINVYDAAGQEIVDGKVDAQGGDFILIDNSRREKTARSFTITNNSENNHSLVFFFVEAAKSSDQRQEIPEMFDESSDVVMGFGEKISSSLVSSSNTKKEANILLEMADAMRGWSDAERARYQSIADVVKKINPFFNEKFLFEVYLVKKGYFKKAEHQDKVSECKIMLEDFRYIEKKEMFIADDADFIRKYSAENKIIEDPLIRYFKNKFGISGVYIVTNGKVEETISQHSLLGFIRSDIFVPKEFGDFVEFYLLVGNIVMEEILFDKSNRIKNKVDLGVRILGKQALSFELGNKEAGFQIFERLRLPYPPGIVLSKDLVLAFIKASPKQKKIYEDFIMLHLDKVIRKNNYEVAVRSNPKNSMPGILKTGRTDKLVARTNQILHLIQECAEAWYSNKAQAYRRRKDIDHVFSLSLIIQEFKGSSFSFSLRDMFDFYGAGVFSTRDPKTGKNLLVGRYVRNNTGDKLMTHGNVGEDIQELEKTDSNIFLQLVDAGNRIEKETGYPQEIEFVAYDGKIYFLQTRNLAFSVQGEIFYIKEKMKSGVLSQARAIPRLAALSEQINERIFYRVRQGANTKVIANGLFSTPGAMQGVVAFGVKKAKKYSNQGKAVIAVVTEINREEIINIMFKIKKFGLMTTYGSDSSHEAVLTRAAGIPSIVNVQGIIVENRQLLYEKGGIVNEGDIVVLDGDNNRVLLAKENVLEVNTIVEDASHGINIAQYRKEVLGGYLTSAKKVKEEYSYEVLIRMNAQATVEIWRLQSLGKKKEAFKANLKKHFLHELLLEVAEKTQRLNEVEGDLAKEFIKVFDMKEHMPVSDNWKDHRTLEDNEKEYPAIVDEIEKQGLEIVSTWAGYCPIGSNENLGVKRFLERQSVAREQSKLLADAFGGKVMEKEYYIIYHEPCHAENEDLVAFIFVVRGVSNASSTEEAAASSNIMGKDFEILKTFFDGNCEKTMNAINQWQGEFKAKLGQEKTLFQMTTFKDAAHLDCVEYFLITDEEGNYTGEIKPRDLCHFDGLWHRTVGIIVIDRDGKMYVQIRAKRSANDTKAGMKDVSAGGHAGLDRDMVVAAIREIEEEIFDQKTRISEERLVRLTPEGEYVKNYEGCENATFFVYFISEKEKKEISLQESELAGLKLKNFEDVVSGYLSSNQGEGYTVGFFFFDDFETRAFIKGTPQNFLKNLIVFARSFMNSGKYSDVTFVMDKDGTMTEPNELIEKNIVDAIVGLIEKGVSIEALTGGMLVNSQETVIVPIEKEIKRRGLIGLLKYFTYRYASGVGYVFWEKGNQVKKFRAELYFNKDKMIAVGKATSVAFLESIKSLNIEDLDSFQIDEVIEEINKLTIYEDIVLKFNSYMKRKENVIGSIEIQDDVNNDDLYIKFCLELAVSGGRQARQDIKNSVFMATVFNRFKELLAQDNVEIEYILNYGDTYLEMALIDKEKTLRNILRERNSDNPLVVGIGDGRNDYGFLSLPLNRGTKLSYFVGEMADDLPENILIWPTSGPTGTQEILSLALAMLKSSSSIDFNLEKLLPFFPCKGALNQQLRVWQKEWKESFEEEISAQELIKKEFFCVCDLDGKLTGEIVPRDLAHAKGVWHRGSIVIVIDSEGKMLRQQRAFIKKVFPGAYEISATGHNGVVEDLKKAAVVELNEEIFNDKYKVDSGRLVAVNEDSGKEFIEIIEAKDTTNNRKIYDRERSVIYLFFITDEEKTKIEFQPEEVESEGSIFVDMDAEFEKGKNNKEYTNLFKAIAGDSEFIHAIKKTVKGIDQTRAKKDKISSPSASSNVDRVFETLSLYSQITAENIEQRLFRGRDFSDDEQAELNRFKKILTQDGLMYVNSELEDITNIPHLLTVLKDDRMFPGVCYEATWGMVNILRNNGFTGRFVMRRSEENRYENACEVQLLGETFIMSLTQSLYIEDKGKNLPLDLVIIRPQYVKENRDVLSWLAVHPIVYAHTINKEGQIDSYFVNDPKSEIFIEKKGGEIKSIDLRQDRDDHTISKVIVKDYNGNVECIEAVEMVSSSLIKEKITDAFQISAGVVILGLIVAGGAIVYAGIGIILGIGATIYGLQKLFVKDNPWLVPISVLGIFGAVALTPYLVQSSFESTYDYLQTMEMMSFWIAGISIGGIFGFILYRGAVRLKKYIEVKVDEADKKRIIKNEEMGKKKTKERRISSSPAASNSSLTAIKESIKNLLSKILFFSEEKASEDSSEGTPAEAVEIFDDTAEEIVPFVESTREAILDLIKQRTKEYSESGDNDIILNKIRIPKAIKGSWKKVWRRIGNNKDIVALWGKRIIHREYLQALLEKEKIIVVYQLQGSSQDLKGEYVLKSDFSNYREMLKENNRNISLLLVLSTHIRTSYISNQSAEILVKLDRMKEILCASKSDSIFVEKKSLQDLIAQGRIVEGVNSGGELVYILLNSLHKSKYLSYRNRWLIRSLPIEGDHAALYEAFTIASLKHERTKVGTEGPATNILLDYLYFLYEISRKCATVDLFITAMFQDVPGLYQGVSKNQMGPLKDRGRIDTLDIVHSILAQEFSPRSASSDRRNVDHVQRKYVKMFERDLNYNGDAAWLVFATKIYTFNQLTQEKKFLMREEMEDIWSPLAEDLGLKKVKIIIEEMIFQSDPDLYKKLEEEYVKGVGMSQKALERLLKEDIAGNIKKEFEKSGIKAEIKTQTKEFFSINRKLQNQKNKPIESGRKDYEEVRQLKDLARGMSIVEREEDIYPALAVWNNFMSTRSTIGENDDCIANPRPYGFRGVFQIYDNWHGNSIEMIILTRKMFERCERGDLSHTRYVAGLKGHLIKSADDVANLIGEDLSHNLSEYARVRDVENNIFVNYFIKNQYGEKDGPYVLILPIGSRVLDFLAHRRIDILGNSSFSFSSDRKPSIGIKHLLVSGETIMIEMKARVIFPLEMVTFKTLRGKLMWKDRRVKLIKEETKKGQIKLKEEMRKEGFKRWNDPRVTRGFDEFMFRSGFKEGENTTTQHDELYRAFEYGLVSVNEIIRVGKISSSVGSSKEKVNSPIGKMDKTLPVLPATPLNFSIINVVSPLLLTPMMLGLGVSVASMAKGVIIATIIFGIIMLLRKWFAQKVSAPNTSETSIVILEPLTNKSTFRGRKISSAAFLFIEKISSSSIKNTNRNMLNEVLSSVWRSVYYFSRWGRLAQKRQNEKREIKQLIGSLARRWKEELVGFDVEARNKEIEKVRDIMNLVSKILPLNKFKLLIYYESLELRYKAEKKDGTFNIVPESLATPAGWVRIENLSEKEIRIKLNELLQIKSSSVIGFPMDPEEKRFANRLVAKKNSSSLYVSGFLDDDYLRWFALKVSAPDRGKVFAILPDDEDVEKVSFVGGKPDENEDFSRIIPLFALPPENEIEKVSFVGGKPDENEDFSRIIPLFALPPENEQEDFSKQKNAAPYRFSFFIAFPDEKKRAASSIGNRITKIAIKVVPFVFAIFFTLFANMSAWSQDQKTQAPVASVQVRDLGAFTFDQTQMLYDLLSQMGYRWEVANFIVNEMSLVAERIGFQSFVSDFNKGGIDFAQVYMDMKEALREQDYFNKQRPAYLARLLMDVSQYTQDNIFDLLKNDDLKQRYQGKFSEDALLGSVETQLMYLFLKIAGVNVNVAASEDHVRLIILDGAGQMLFIDAYEDYVDKGFLDNFYDLTNGRWDVIFNGETLGDRDFEFILSDKAPVFFPEYFYLNEDFSGDFLRSDILFNMAIAYDYLKNYDRAIFFYEEGLKFNPYESKAWEALAFAYLNSEDRLRSLSALHSRVPEIHFESLQSGRTPSQTDNVKDKYFKAIDAFGNAGQLDSYNGVAFFYLGRLYYLISENEKGAECFKKALQANPNLETYIENDVKKILKAQKKEKKASSNTFSKEKPLTSKSFSRGGKISSAACFVDKNLGRFSTIYQKAILPRPWLVGNSFAKAAYYFLPVEKALSSPVMSSTLTLKEILEDSAKLKRAFEDGTVLRHVPEFEGFVNLSQARHDQFRSLPIYKHTQKVLFEELPRILEENKNVDFSKRELQMICAALLFHDIGIRKAHLLKYKEVTLREKDEERKHNILRLMKLFIDPKSKTAQDFLDYLKHIDLMPLIQIILGKDAQREIVRIIFPWFIIGLVKERHSMGFSPNIKGRFDNGVVHFQGSGIIFYSIYWYIFNKKVDELWNIDLLSAKNLCSSSLESQRIFSALFNNIKTTTKPIVADISLEAFLPELDDRAQLALAAGGLGFLTGETWGAYSHLKKVVAFGVMPLYEKDKQWNQVNWAKEKNVYPFLANQDGQEKILNLDVNCQYSRYRAHIYWVNRGGTLVFLIRCPELFSKLYQGGDEQTAHYGFLARAFGELMKKLDIHVSVARLNEPQLVFAATVMQNDRDWFRDNGKGQKSVFDQTKISMTTHTPEAAALPYWDLSHIRAVVGADLVRNEIVVNGHVVNAAIGLARMANIINGVAEEHAEVTKIAVLPEFKEKIVGIVNGSDPEIWSSDDLKVILREKGLENITGQDLFEVRRNQKEPLNQYLNKNFGFSFNDSQRPLVALLRRLVPYKEQGILIPGYENEWDKLLHNKYIEWITGDRDRYYETPWDANVSQAKGLQANLLIGGDTYYDTGAVWVRIFKEMMLDEALKGKFLFVEKSGIEIMRKIVNATDVWISMPRPTREACGTSDQRAGLTGGYNIATATGGPLEYILHNKTGWLMDVFKGWELARVVRGFDRQDPWFIKEFQVQAAVFLKNYLEEAMNRYYAYLDEGNTLWIEGLKESMVEAYGKVSIHVMARKYELLFLSILDGTGPEGYLKKLDKEKRVSSTIKKTILLKWFYYLLPGKETLAKRSYCFLLNKKALASRDQKTVFLLTDFRNTENKSCSPTLVDIIKIDLSHQESLSGHFTSSVAGGEWFFLMRHFLLGQRCSSTLISENKVFRVLIVCQSNIFRSRMLKYWFRHQYLLKGKKYRDDIGIRFFSRGMKKPDDDSIKRPCLAIQQSLIPLQESLPEESQEWFSYVYSRYAIHRRTGKPTYFIPRILEERNIESADIVFVATESLRKRVLLVSKSLIDSDKIFLISEFLPKDHFFYQEDIPDIGEMPIVDEKGTQVSWGAKELIELYRQLSFENIVKEAQSVSSNLMIGDNCLIAYLRDGKKLDSSAVLEFICFLQMDADV